MSNGKVALVTGAAGGIGQGVVLRLLKDGFTVAAMDINEKALAELSQRGQSYKSTLSIWPCDQTNEKMTRDAVAKIEAKLGPVEALVNTIGWVGTSRFADEDSDYWRKVIAINLEAVLYSTHAVLKGMVERKRGKMVHFASDAGRVGTSGEVVYSATKGGIIAFAKSLAREHARHNINVNCVSPGPTDTPLLQQEIKDDPELIRRMVRLIPFRRVATPEDQAAVVSFLVSPDSDYLTGQTISCSGGLVMV
ncbi:MAG TPA: SDR family oxidoreductase [Hypericibacter adhaerens]|jgi:2-hydroxycyclohexanecarboxyl-CoA dehydrogenase|uniref:Acetoacetyl-CoA reductase n=1 Tax=Hypericibacter adhaerens TaxID=2602016 RepID=A0A5J6MWG0_9PROT|nr:SDR family oxidoreductase [Hypericibacter adhaerens]QEX22052.1 acetoacetyl-CoA reductase [Hypericibacter adhaerens]HWA46290.1 SDR family oxidoreductase [Hypericibacter adhaerens]